MITQHNHAMTKAPLDIRLLTLVQRQYRLEWDGLHGAAHWARVLENGLHLCDATPDLRRDVVVYFALLHDACRQDDGRDADHGPRAAVFAAEMHRNGHLPVDEEGMALLTEACRTHTGGRIPAHPTVMACWDSDRLDLPRICGVRVRTDQLGTSAARDPETVAWAAERAKAGSFPWADWFVPPIAMPE